MACASRLVARTLRKRLRLVVGHDVRSMHLVVVHGGACCIMVVVVVVVRRRHEDGHADGGCDGDADHEY